jgi:hypothetical protein
VARPIGRLLASLGTALVLAGCAASGSGGGAAETGVETASLWVTRDRGSEVLLTAKVPAGLTVLQALDREADIETRYAGRFVQAVEGIAGSLQRQQDWFYFVNGIEPDVGAAEVKLRPGDIAWWDFRSWEGEMAEPVVVGAFPEPFVHGWDGRTRPLEIAAPPELREQRDALSVVLARVGEGKPNRFVLEVEAGAEGATLTATRGPANDSPVTFTLSGSLAAVRAAADALARDPAIVRYRYTASFDAQGRLVE